MIHQLSVVLYVLCSKHLEFINNQAHKIYNRHIFRQGNALASYPRRVHNVLLLMLGEKRNILKSRRMSFISALTAKYLLLTFLLECWTYLWWAAITGWAALWAIAPTKHSPCQHIFICQSLTMTTKTQLTKNRNLFSVHKAFLRTSSSFRWRKSESWDGFSDSWGPYSHCSEALPQLFCAAGF